MALFLTSLQMDLEVNVLFAEKNCAALMKKHWAKNSCETFLKRAFVTWSMFPDKHFRNVRIILYSKTLNTLNPSYSDTNRLLWLLKWKNVRLSIFYPPPKARKKSVYIKFIFLTIYYVSDSLFTWNLFSKTQIMKALLFHTHFKKYP